MPIEAIQPGQNGTGIANTTSKWSPSVWNGFPIEGIRNGLVDGIVQEWHFGTLQPYGTGAAEAYLDQGLLVFGSTGAAGTYFAGPNLDNGYNMLSDGDNEGMGLRSQLVPFKLSRASKRFAFEIVLEDDTITDTKHGFFAGLIENSAITATSPIAAAGTLADLNFVGFHRLEGDGDKLDCVYKANGVTQVTVAADAVTLAVDTEVRLGMTYGQRPDFDTNSRFTLRFWNNDLPIASGNKVIPSTDGDDFPNDIALGFIVTLLNATGSTPGSLTIKRARVAQEF